MKKAYLLLIFAISLSLCSCINDNSTEAANSSSLLSLTKPLDKTYSLNRWETLTITPQVAQTNKQKDISYEWEINYKVVSKEKDLKYVCADFGKFPARLKITNGDDIRYYEFNIDVQYSYGQGVYALAQHEGKAILSYIPDGAEGKTFALDVLKKNNPNTDFTGTANAIDYTVASGGKPLMYIAVGNPSKIYELNPNLMTIGFSITATGNVSWLKRDPRGYPALMLVKEDDKLKTLRMLSPSATLVPYSSYWEKKVNDNTLNFANAATLWKSEDLRYTHAIAYYDNTAGHLFVQASQYPKSPDEILKGKFSKQTLIGIGGINQERKIALITYNKDTHKYVFYHIFPGFFSSKKEKQQEPNIIYQKEMPANTGINENSIVCTTPTKNLVYYSSANKIYGYNVLSNGSFPTEPLFSVGEESENIVDLYISPDDSKLYIATNNTKGSLVGSIYCYNLVDNKMIWQKRNITGKIVKITYRNPETK